MRDGRNSWCKACVVVLQRNCRQRRHSAPEGREKTRQQKAAARRKKGIPPRLHAAHVRDYLLFLKVSNAPKPKHDAHVLRREKVLRKAEKPVVKDPGANHRRRIKRRVGNSKPIPKWANSKAIKAIYADAARIFAETGVEVEVDHIVPLKNKLVCGLHCEANLWILPKWVNQEKSNRVWPDMPE